MNSEHFAGLYWTLDVNLSSVDPFDLPFELLALRYPNKAAEQLSVNYQLYYKKMPSFGKNQDLSGYTGWEI